MRLAHIAHTGPAWKKTDQKDRDINKGEKGALYAKSKKRGNFGVLRRSFPRQGGHPTNFLTTLIYMQHFTNQLLLRKWL